MKVSRKYQTVSQVKRDVFKDYIRISGQVIPIQVVQLSPEEGGIVRDIVLEEGAKVRKGDVILRLSNSNLDLQILNAEAELAEKQNLLRNTQITMQQDLLNNRTERISLDQDVQRKKRNFEQNRRLYEERLISRETYLQSREDYDLVCRKHDLIVQRLRQDSISRSVQMEQMEENLTNMQQNVIAVRGRREKLELRSAIDGELGLLDVELGQSIAAGEKVGQINDLSDFKIQSQLDEHYIDRVRTGLQAMFVRDGKTYQVENTEGKGFANEPMRGNLKIVKTSSDGKVEGFAFRITGANGYDVTLETDENGEIFLEGLRIGEYKISEVNNSASAMYILPADKEAAVQTGSTTVVEMHNELRDTPKTGDDSKLGLWIALAGVSVAGIAACGIIGFKKKKKEDN